MGEEEARQLDHGGRSDVRGWLLVVANRAGLARSDQPLSAPPASSSFSSHFDRNFRALSVFAQSTRSCGRRVLSVDCGLRTAHCFSTTDFSCLCLCCQTWKEYLKDCWKKRDDVLEMDAFEVAYADRRRTVGSASA